MSAYGFSLGQPLLPSFNFAGVRLPFATLMFPGGRVAAYVRSTGIQSLDPQEIADNLVMSLKDALHRVRDGMGDIIYVLPGHREDVTDADFMSGLRAGTKIIGAGDPAQSDAPTFRWVATGAQWALSADDVSVTGLRLRLEGANGVTKAIAISGAGCSITGCHVEVASGDENKSTIAIEVTGHRARIVGNYIFGTETHNVTDGVLVAGATPPSDVAIENNVMIFSATAGNGNVRVSVAAKRMRVIGNVLYNTHTNSTACIAFGDVACDGVMAYNAMGTTNNGTVTNQGATFGTAALIRCFHSFSCDEPKKSGVLTPGVAT